MATREFLIKNQQFTLSELASTIKDIVEKTQNSEHPAFELLPGHVQFKEDFNWSWDGKSGPDIKAGDEFVLLRCDYTSAFNEMWNLLPEIMQAAIEAVCTLDLEDRFEEYRSHTNFQKYDSLDEMIQKLQKSEREQKGKKTMEQENKTQTEEKQEWKVYLSLPPTSPKAFKTMTNNLKEAGAKFDSYNKAWYITSDMDFNQFKGFLGLPYEQVKERGAKLRAAEAERKAEEKRPEENRNSVKGKLEKNKEAVEKNTPEKKEPNRNREAAR